MWSMWAHQSGNEFHHASLSRGFVELYGSDKPIVAVDVVEDPQGDYYGWLDAGSKKQVPSLIWPSQTLFEICFPGGATHEEAIGKGRVVRLTITASQAPRAG